MDSKTTRENMLNEQIVTKNGQICFTNVETGDETCLGEPIWFYPVISVVRIIASIGFVILAICMIWKVWKTFEWMKNRAYKTGSIVSSTIPTSSFQ